jgi:hypothetical protein
VRLDEKLECFRCRTRRLYSVIKCFPVIFEKLRTIVTKERNPKSGRTSGARAQRAWLHEANNQRVMSRTSSRQSDSPLIPPSVHDSDMAGVSPKVMYSHQLM